MKTLIILLLLAQVGLADVPPCVIGTYYISDYQGNVICGSPKGEGDTVYIGHTPNIISFVDHGTIQLSKDSKGNITYVSPEITAFVLKQEHDDLIKYNKELIAVLARELSFEQEVEKQSVRPPIPNTIK